MLATIAILRTHEGSYVPCIFITFHLAFNMVLMAYEIFPYEKFHSNTNPFKFATIMYVAMYIFLYINNCFIQQDYEQHF